MAHIAAMTIADFQTTLKSCEKMHGELLTTDTKDEKTITDTLSFLTSVLQHLKADLKTEGDAKDGSTRGTYYALAKRISKLQEMAVFVSKDLDKRGDSFQVKQEYASIRATFQELG